MSNLDVKEIVGKYLKDEGFDGLYSYGGECACMLDDLAPCLELGSDCIAGYHGPCPEECGEHDWHIGEKRPVSTDDGGVE